MIALQKQQKKAPQDRFFTAWRIAASPSAKALVNDVRERFLKHEAEVAPRKRARRQNDELVFKQQIEAIVSNLCYEYLANPECGVSTTLSKTILGNQGRYGSKVLNNTYPKVIKLLSDPTLGLVDRIGGNPFDWDGDGVKQTTIKADVELQKLIAKYQLTVSDFQVVNKGEVIILRRERENKFDDNTVPIPYEDTEETIRYRSEVQRINEWLTKAEIEFDETCCNSFIDGRDRHLKRIFNNGNFSEGGRLFGGFWQPISKRQRRLGITINDGPVTALDFGQIAPRILYGMVGVQPSFDDAYQLAGIDPKYRPGIKKVFNSLLFADSLPTRFPKGVRELIPDKSISVSNVINSIVEAHKPIAHLFCTDIGLKVMFKESQILINILSNLIDEGIVALPIHDALVVEEYVAPQVQEIMVNTFKKHTGVAIPVTTDND